MIYKIAELLANAGYNMQKLPDKVLNIKFPNHIGKDGHFPIWQLIVSAADKELTVKADGWGDLKVKPGHFYMLWDGWLAGTINFVGGQFAAHPNGANQKNFLASLKKFTEAKP